MPICSLKRQEHPFRPKSNILTKSHVALLRYVFSMMTRLGRLLYLKNRNVCCCAARTLHTTTALDYALAEPCRFVPMTVGSPPSAQCSDRIPTESRPNPEGIPMCSKDIPRYPEGESRQGNALDDTSYVCPVKPSRNSVFSGYWGNSLILPFLTYNIYG